ncbi:MAG: bifunctional diaminohydroxyphosphoribosylaminopyrimidine deaminase/5-amino-6-(5-phosphoribosylamino)uracil reductase RibD [Nitrospirae bacterium]|nr:bifunctional diaminohydroxyphosphoribosylaminopyrimidine deaminase/5-amino-6-(5-phosphoribosylamino)uracil reductase RibD [Nitrospirota bacterium]
MTDGQYIKKAISLAKKGQGRTSPNPMVGALLVKKGRIISEGYHKKAGTPHAEAIAIDKAGPAAEGSTLYVSLEPCCHKDKRTPPCTEKIISAGIKKVVISMEDPNPKVSGKGIEVLRRAGIEVSAGLLEEKAVELNEYYIKHIRTGLPFVVLKAAITLDGRIATPDGESKWITGEKARRAVHGLRGNVDAIMTAIGTVRADDPRLTCRIKGRPSPVRVILDPRLEINPDANVLTCPPRTLIVTAKAGKTEKKKLLRQRGMEFIEHEGKRADLPALMKTLGSMGIISVLVEGGSSLNASCLESGIVDKVMFFTAPKIIGGRDAIPVVGGDVSRSLSGAHRIVKTRMRRFGEDFLIEGYVQKNN